MHSVMLFALLLQAGSWPVASVQVQGVSRFSAQDVAGASGMKVNSRAGAADLDAACARLMKTGLFRSCNYRYSPGPQGAISVEFTVSEMPAEQTVKLTVPGTAEKRVWDWLQKNEPLVQDRMPPNDDAIAFYTAAVQRFAKAELGEADLTAAVESDLQRREQTFVFRSKNLAPVSDVLFTGESSIPMEKLRQALLPVAKGSGFNQFDIRRLLDINVKPLFERQGRLRIEFPSVTAEKIDGGVRVNIAVVEGLVFKLRTVTSAGEGVPGADKLKAAPFPVGDVANWQKIETAAETLRQALRNEGYLAARFTLGRKLHDDGAADVDITFNRGSQFTFGQLTLQGLSAFQEKRIRAQWKLREGEPMNEGYVNDFLRSVNKDLPGSTTHISVDLPIRPQSTIADVRINFGR
jgi:outer membrane protein assembly factor BamA